MILTYQEFEKLVEEGIKAVPEKFLKKLNNVGIVIEDFPTFEQLKKMKIRKNSIIFGLYEGVPQNKRWHYSDVLPDKITIFKGEIEKVAQSENEIKEIVKDTIWHEIAHHFGFDEKEVRELELRREKFK